MSSCTGSQIKSINEIFNYLGKIWLFRVSNSLLRDWAFLSWRWWITHRNAGGVLCRPILLEFILMYLNYKSSIPPPLKYRMGYDEHEKWLSFFKRTDRRLSSWNTKESSDWGRNLHTTWRMSKSWMVFVLIVWLWRIRWGLLTGDDGVWITIFLLTYYQI